MSDTTIRPARREDCPRLIELVLELAVFERAPDAVTVPPAHFEEAGFGQHPVWQAVVAEDGGALVGFALWYIRFSTWTGCRLYLEDIVVTASRRGEGIGRRLFEATLAEARRRGYAGMTWQMLDWNAAARRFYDRFEPRYDDEWVNCHLDFPEPGAAPVAGGEREASSPTIVGHGSAWKTGRPSPAE
jgi:GNAT superfamily N-acetyltransferase